MSKLLDFGMYRGQPISSCRPSYILYLISRWQFRWKQPETCREMLLDLRRRLIDSPDETIAEILAPPQGFRSWEWFALLKPALREQRRFDKKAALEERREFERWAKSAAGKAAAELIGEPLR